MDSKDNSSKVIFSVLSVLPIYSSNILQYYSTILQFLPVVLIISFLIQTAFTELNDHLCSLVDRGHHMVEVHELELIYVAQQLLIDGRYLMVL